MHTGRIGEKSWLESVPGKCNTLGKYKCLMTYLITGGHGDLVSSWVWKWRVTEVIHHKNKHMKQMAQFFGRDFAQH